MEANKAKNLTDEELYRLMKTVMESHASFADVMKDASYGIAVVCEMAARWYQNKKLLDESLACGDEVWYVELEDGRIDHGIVSTVSYKDGRLDSIGIDFDGDDFDEIVGESYGRRLFKTEEAAKLALRMWSGSEEV